MIVTSDLYGDIFLCLQCLFQTSQLYGILFNTQELGQQIEDVYCCSKELTAVFWPFQESQLY